MFVVRTFVTKPAGTAWYEHNPTLGTQTVFQWASTQSQILHGTTVDASPDRKINTMIFADRDAYESFVASRDANPLWQDLNTYFTNNNVSVVVKKFQEVE